MGSFTDSIQCVMNCNAAEILLVKNPNKARLTKIINILGKETMIQNNKILFYIYDDGTIKKRITIK